MNDPITSLTDEQAIHAVKLFFDFAPPELWAEEEKPSPERVKTIAAAVVQQAPPDLQTGLAALLKDGKAASAPARAQVCRLILNQLQQSEAFRPALNRAVETASRPHMAIDPVTGAFIIALLLSTAKVEKTADGWKVHSGGVAVDALKALRLPELLHELPAVIKALPQGVWGALTGHAT